MQLNTLEFSYTVSSFKGRSVHRGGSGSSNKPPFFAVGYVPVQMSEKCDSVNKQHVMANCSLDGNKSKDQTLGLHFSQCGLLQGL